jgi:hypothetical protein
MNSYRINRPWTRQHSHIIPLAHTTKKECFVLITCHLQTFFTYITHSHTVLPLFLFLIFIVIWFFILDHTFYINSVWIQCKVWNLLLCFAVVGQHFFFYAALKMATNLAKTCSYWHSVKIHVVLTDYLLVLFTSGCVK